jgi:hypothetical protein
MMNDEVILSYLEELAEKLEILVRDENINIEESSSSGGLCRVEGKRVIILNSKATIKEKIQVMITSLQQFDPVICILNQLSGNYWMDIRKHFNDTHRINL